MNLTLKDVLSFFVILYHLKCFTHGIEVLTPSGRIIGSNHLRTRHGKVIYSFTGIPYAQPPVGNLRFKDPQPVKPWNKPLNATKLGPECPQIEVSSITEQCVKLHGQEDCLYLDVYSPKLDPNANLAVMFFIHGGAFYLMKGNGSSPEFLLDRDVILVDFNYRLGAMGFMTTGDGVIPANLGMKDQSIALRWVYDNIKSFGGDPNSITVFGQGVGGTCAHFHMLSPLSKDLIKRGISMSGTVTSPWALISPQLAIDRTKALAVLCDCPIDSSEKLLACMRSIPIQIIIEMQSKFQLCEQNKLFIPLVTFAPVVEKGVKNAFLPSDPETIESSIPFITGSTSGEGLFFASRFFANRDHISELEKHISHILPRSSLLDLKFFGDDGQSTMKKIVQFYMKNNGRNVQNIVDMFTDGWYLSRVVSAAAFHTGDAYLYYYDYLGSVSFSSVIGTGDLKGVCDADDALNLFPLNDTFPNREWPEKDLKVSETMLDLWTNFAKYGKPTVNTSVKWEPTGKRTKSIRHLTISADGLFKEDENFLPERVAFWSGLIANNKKL